MVRELDDLFARARSQSDLEVQSDYAKFLVIRVSGLIEQAITEIVSSYTQPRAHPTIVEHVDWRMKRFQNPTRDRILQLAGSFQRNWRTELETQITEEEREALGSINAQRNKIAHGQPSTISLSQVDQYYTEAKTLLDKIAVLFA